METNLIQRVEIEFTEEERDVLRRALWGGHVKTRSDAHDHIEEGSDQDEIWHDVRTARSKATRPGKDEYKEGEIDEMADHLVQLDPEDETANELIEDLEYVLVGLEKSTGGWIKGAKYREKD